MEMEWGKKGGVGLSPLIRSLRLDRNVFLQPQSDPAATYPANIHFIVKLVH